MSKPSSISPTYSTLKMNINRYLNENQIYGGTKEEALRNIER